MVLEPKCLIERYNVSNNKVSSIPDIVEDFDSVSIRLGIETIKDTFSIKIPIKVDVSTGSTDTIMDAKKETVKRFKVNDIVKIYGYFGSQSTHKDDDLLIAGTIKEYSFTADEDKYIVTLKGVNRSEELLHTLVPYSSRATAGSANTVPTAIKQMVNRLNRWHRGNTSLQCLAYLSNEINPVTGSYGNIQATQSDYSTLYTDGLSAWGHDGTAFPTIDYNETWKPVYINIEKLSTPEYTGDSNAGEYIYYVKYVNVLPSYRHIYGNVANELVWKSKVEGNQVIINGTIKEEDFNVLNVNLDTREVKNLYIVNAGTDLNGAGIHGVAYNLESIGKYGMRGDYYSKSRRTFSKLYSLEFTAGSVAGSSFDYDGYPTTYPWTFGFEKRDVYGNKTGTYVTADNKKEFNQALRDEARWVAVSEAQEILKILGEPRFSLSGELYGLNNHSYVLGAIYNFEVKGMGWVGTTNYPVRALRCQSITHTFDKSGWHTKIEFFEDEKVIQNMIRA